MPSSQCRVSSYRPTTWIAQPASPCRRKITSLTALASWSFQSVTSVLTTRWRWGRRGFHSLVGRAERVVAVVRAHARDVADAVGTEGGDDVVGPAVVQRVGVRGDRGADALDDVGVGRRGAHASETDVDDRHLERVHVDGSAAPGAAARREGRRGSRRRSVRSSRCVPRPARTGACTRSPSRAGPSAGAAGSRSPGRGSAATADRRSPTPRAAWAAPARSPSGNRASDQISISVSSGPSGRKRYDEALLYMGNRKKCGKQ